jgi:pilus assembly protein Flp/PilA
MIMLKLIQKFIRDEEGVTAIEYGLIAALIGVAIVAAVSSVGGELNTLFGTIQTNLAGG